MHWGWKCAAPNELPDAGPGDAPKGTLPDLGRRRAWLFYISCALQCVGKCDAWIKERWQCNVMVAFMGVTMLQSGGELVHVPMSLRARTAVQGELEPTHVPMSPLGEDRCVGEGARMIQNSLEESGRFRSFWRLLERCYRKVPEEWVSNI